MAGNEDNLESSSGESLGSTETNSNERSTQIIRLFVFLLILFVIWYGLELAEI